MVLYTPSNDSVTFVPTVGPLKEESGAMCYVQKSLACYVLCKFCEIKIGCYAEV